VSAAPFYSLWALHPPGEVHLSCGNGVPKPGIIDHAPCGHPTQPGFPVAGLADVLLHALRCLPELEALALVQSATGRGEISADFLRDKLIGNRNGRARAVLGLLIPRSDSVLEVLAHTHFVRAGLKVRMHVPLPGVGEVDCLVEECLVVELDGSTHFEPRQVKKDHRRNNAGMRGGFLTLRYYYDDVVYHPEAMVEEVRAVLQLRALGRFAPE
jgi:very-short-patch-repair endonuclease